MSEVKRYDMDQTGCEVEDSDGLWVKASDYDALAAQRDEGLAREAELRSKGAAVVLPMDCEENTRTRRGMDYAQGWNEALAVVRKMNPKPLPMLSGEAETLGVIDKTRAGMAVNLTQAGRSSCDGIELIDRAQFTALHQRLGDAEKTIRTSLDRIEHGRRGANITSQDLWDACEILESYYC